MTHTPAIINIGMDVNDGGLPIGPAIIRRALRNAGAVVLNDTCHVSDSEPTFVARLAAPLPADVAYALSMELRQDCIAQAVGLSGKLHGPKAAAWGPFNPDYFLQFDGSRLAPLADAA